jgi:peptidoglycan/xylan/chitin deacetylase (PgdA/CDA1 family)
MVMLHNFANLGDAQGILKDYKAWGYETIFYADAMDYLTTGNASGLPEKPLVLTVDDGGLSNYQYLFPALQEFGMKATFFIVPHWINGNITTPPNGGVFMEANHFTWANAVEMHDSGLVRFQSHTLTHGSMRALTGAGTFTADLSADGTGAGADFLAAKTMIEANVPGANVQYNAAPYGVINEAAIASLKTAGCKGNRITQCGRNTAGEYDGSGPFAFTLASTDPYRVPIASDGSMKALKRANVYGEADADGNRVQNGKFLVTSRGFTLPAGWTTPSVTLPNGTTGPALRGFGTAAATGAYHTDLIPVGFWAAYSFDFYAQVTLGGATSARLVFDCYETPSGTLVKTIADPPGAQTSNTSWTHKRWSILGDGTYAWVRPRFEVVGATSTSEFLVWDARLRVQKNALATGGPAALI